MKDGIHEILEVIEWLLTGADYGYTKSKKKDECKH